MGTLDAAYLSRDICRRSSLPRRIPSKNVTISFSSSDTFPCYSSRIFFSIYAAVSSKLFSFPLILSARWPTGNCGMAFCFYTSMRLSLSSSTLARMRVANLCSSSALGAVKKDFSSLFSIWILAFSSSSVSWWCFRFLASYCTPRRFSCSLATYSTRCYVMTRSLWVSLN